MTSTETTVLLGAQVTSGLLTGLYLAFSIAVMPALRGVPDDVFIDVMNRVNRAIVSPLFLLIFLGSPALGAAVLWWHHGPAGWIVAGCGVIALVVTIVANVPRNDALATGGARAAFERPWCVWHTVRTAASLVGFVTLCRIAAS